MEKLVSAVIVNWNGEKYLYKCIKSLLDQEYSNLEIILIDNDSSDKSIEIAKKHFGDKIRIIRNENTGYAGGSNKGIEESKGEYILIANPDVVFEKNYIALCVKKLEENNKYAAVMGKLLKYDFDIDKKLNVIDSVGISLNHSRQGSDIDQNIEDTGKHEKDRRIFGACGAAAMFKTSALNKVAINGEIFDNDFFAYKEDIDLAWRLNLYGYQCIYVHNAIAYHGRGMNSSTGIINTIKNRRSQSEFLKGISFRNHYLMLMKNETEYTFKKDRIGIYTGLMKYLVFFLLFDFKCLKYIKQIKNNRKLMMEKRQIIMKNNVLTDKEAYELFNL